jgi:hypothetical protein
VTADGAVPGDRVQLLRLDGSTWTLLSSTTLNDQSVASFTVPTPASGQTVHYRVRVLETRRHGLGRCPVTLTGA